jgi:two-component system sensor histidine kinase KdpD
VESPAQRPLSAAERRALAGTVKLAEDLGASTVTLSGVSVAEALIAFARERNVSRIVVGKPLHGRWRDRFRGSLLDEIVRGSGGIEVMVIPGGEDPVRMAAPPDPVPVAGRGLQYLSSVGVVLLSTLVCWAMHDRFDKSNLIMVYLLGVAVVATQYGRRHSVLAAVLSVAAFDFFFVPPHLTFAVTDTQYVVTFAVMLLVSLLISTLAARVRAQAEASLWREQRTRVLYALSRDLAGAHTTTAVAKVAAHHIADILQGPAEIFLADGQGRLVSAEPGRFVEARETAVAQWAFDHGQRAGLGTDTLPGATATYVPLPGTRESLGVLGVRAGDALLPLAPDQLDLLETLAQQAASGLERARLAAEAEQARLAVESERLRNTLLSSVSHDLRTPLATITGAASTLLQPGALTEEGRRELTGAIYEEAERLNRLVTNLLDMTRLESGSLRLNRDWHSMEELVGTALARLRAGLEGRTVRVQVPPDVPLVLVDGLLVEQLLVNLLDNALKYSGPATALEVAAHREGDALVVEVRDEGPGLAPGSEERVFDKFYRGEGSPQGFGLGLPICKAIVTAHGGQISAANRDPRGAAFRFTLPLSEPPPPVEEDRDAA